MNKAKATIKAADKADLVGPYLPMVNGNEDLQALLYDIDLLPEQIGNIHDAHVFVVLCELYKMTVICAKFDNAARGLLTSTEDDKISAYAAQLAECSEKLAEIKGNASKAA